MERKEESATSGAKDLQAAPVVLPVCDELFGEAIADFVTKHNWTCDPVFHILFVVELGALPVLAPDVAPQVEDDEKMYGWKLIRLLSEKLTRSIPKARIVGHVATGSAATEILNLADSVNAHMIVLGSHGRTGFRKLVLGSVSTSVMSNARCSTVIVRPAQLKNATQSDLAAITDSDLPAKMTTLAPVE